MSIATSSVEIVQFPCLNDNYGYLIHDKISNLTACVDTPDANAIEHYLDQMDWRLNFILNTHHHFDHVGGNLALKQKTRCQIVGPRADTDRIPGIDISVGEGDIFEFGASNALIYDTPGHTRGHIVYYFANAKAAFVGDTLFALGCGRLFEGSAEQMWTSLQKLLLWPDDTRIYCAHEYTQANARFALTIEPENTDLISRSREIDRLRNAGKSTIPTTIGLERKTNPFLRPHSLNLQTTLDMFGKSELAVFAEIRRRKDYF